jgi:cell wall-associated NlpC family hydrolase
LPSDDLLKPSSSSSTDAIASGPTTPILRAPSHPTPGTSRSADGPVPTANRRRTVRVMMTAGVLGLALVGVTSANAAPKPSIAEVQRKIEKLRTQAEQASEDYNETREQLKSVDVRLKAAQDKLKRQRGEVQVARTQVGRLAAETYRRGELSTLDLVLGDDPDNALAQAGYLPSLGERQAGAMTRLKEGEKKLTTTEAEIKAQQGKAEAAKARMNKNRKLVDKRLDAANAELNRLEASQRKKLREAQEKTANAGVPSGGGGSSSGGGGSANCNGKAVNAPSGAARKAIAFACAQLGDPYLWAATGPNKWDCSGLTMKAYAAGGVSLPHSSKLQANYGSRVSVSSLQPGDLVFFHSPISHVGMYIGDGLMVHAPSSGDVVRVASLYATPSAAVRL